MTQLCHRSTCTNVDLSGRAAAPIFGRKADGNTLEDLACFYNHQVRRGSDTIEPLWSNLPVGFKDIEEMLFERTQPKLSTASEWSMKSLRISDILNEGACEARPTSPFRCFSVQKI